MYVSFLFIEHSPLNSSLEVSHDSNSTQSANKCRPKRQGVLVHVCVVHMRACVCVCVHSCVCAFVCVYICVCGWVGVNKVVLIQSSCYDLIFSVAVGNKTVCSSSVLLKKTAAVNSDRETNIESYNYSY